MAFSNVLLPAPLGPTIATRSPTRERERGIFQRGFAVTVMDRDPAELHHRRIRPVGFRFADERSEHHQFFCFNAFDDFLHIIAHHVDIRRCIAARLSHRMGVKIVHDRDPGLLGQLVGQLWIGACLQKDRRRPCCLQVIHQARQLLGRRRCAGADAGDHRADDTKSVAVGEVAEALVVGHQQASRFRHRLYLAGDPGVQFAQLADVGLGVLCIQLVALRVNLAQCVTDVFRIVDYADRVQPEVRVAGIVMMAASGAK